jgi:subtilisin family serine protease
VSWRRRSLLLVALAVVVPAPAAAAASKRVEVVVELKAPGLAASVPRGALHGPDGRYSPHAFGSRLALPGIESAQQQVAAGLRRAAPGLKVRARLQIVMDALVVTVPVREEPRLADVRGVRRVWASVVHRVQTDRVPTLIDAVPLWGTPGVPGGTLGDGMRIGIIDDGIDINRPSFSGVGYSYPPGFPKGIKSGTNGKVIVARVFPPPDSTPRERTAFDTGMSEHGTHVAGIAAGNSGITAHLATGLDVPNLSGVAPRAYLGSYRALTTPTPDFGLDGNGAEIAEAIDKAVSDGMDVLNLSLGEPEVALQRDVVVRAIEGAAKAGVVTAVAAGNQGDAEGEGSVSSPGTAPDAITVGAVTNDRFFGVGMAVLGPGAVPASLASFGGVPADITQIPAGWSQGVPLTVSTHCGAGGSGSAVLLVRLSHTCTSDEAVGAGANALGLVLADDGAGDPDTPASSGSRPVIQISDLLGRQLASAASAAGGTLTVSVSNQLAPIISGNGGLTTSFSSIGPTPMSLELKPDVSAPGQGILSPIPSGYGIWNGTSMATPAVAGAAALLMQRHPTWTPQEVRQALMLTAVPVFHDTARTIQATPLQAGEGMIDVAAADRTPLFAEPASLSFGLRRQGSTASREVQLRDAGTGAGTWTVDAPGLEAPASVVVPAGGSVGLALRLHVASSAAQGNQQGFVILRRGTDSVHLDWWGYVEKPLLASEHVTAIRPGWTSGDTRRGVSRVSRYRWPATPTGDGLPLRYPGREQVFSFRVPPGAANAGVRVEGNAVPQILLADDENRLAGETALPMSSNPYLARYGAAEPVSALLLPSPGHYYVSVETKPGTRPGPYRLRLWIDDRTPPTVSGVPARVPPRGDLRFTIADSGSGVSWSDVQIQVDGTSRTFHYDPSTGRVDVALPGVANGKHTLRVFAPDIQETKNSENASALGLPNSRVVVRSLRVG